MKIRLVLGLFPVFFFSTWAHAQSPNLSSVFPPGGRRGATVSVKLAGKNLKNVRRLFFSHPGIKSQAIKANQVTVAIGADVPAGGYDVWALTDKGLSNPRRFAVGSLPEINEKEKNGNAASAQHVTFPVTINGTLKPGTDRDFYRFEINAGQPIHCRFCSATLDGTATAALTIYGPKGKELLHDDGRDAEPALDFQVNQGGSYVLKIEERGFQSGDNNVYRLSLFTGPCLVAAFPRLLIPGKTGPVTLYGYNLPHGVKAGPKQSTERNSVQQESARVRPLSLQQLRVEIKAPRIGEDGGGGPLAAHAAMLEGFRYRHPKIPGTLRLGLTIGPVTLDDETPHNSMKNAQLISLPCTIAGRFLQGREVDWYRIAVKKGESLWLETVGERDGENMDLELAIHTSTGKVVKTASDYTVKKSPVPVDTLDAMTAWKAPATGDYYIVVRDLYGTTRFGVRRSYRLSVGQRLEKVCVTAMPSGKTPSGFSVPAGGTAKLQLAALRYNGHQDAIRVRVENLPAGLQAKSVTIPAKKNTASLTFVAKKDAQMWVGRLKLIAETKINGNQKSFPVVALTSVRTGEPPRRCQGIVAAIVFTSPASKARR